ncbi:MAG: DNA recombination protein RmuC [Prevotellaceae bacterium]|jgi:DNA recombination protein RmuC|nr:DNA recombination protein RmuC [Prevotellaceae bacterium]
MDAKQGKYSMATTILLVVLIIVVIINLICTLTKKIKVNSDDVLSKLNGVNSDVQKIDTLIRDEFGRNRDANQNAFRENREELSNSFRTLSETLTRTVTDLSTGQKNLFETFSQQLNSLDNRLADNLRNLIEQSRNEATENRGELNNSFRTLSETLIKTVTDFSDTQKNQLLEMTKTFGDKTTTLQEQLANSAKENRTEQSSSLKSFEDKFTQNVKDFNELQRQKFDDLANKQESIKKETETKLTEIRETVEGKLTNIQNDNNQKLEEMRKTVDEKLQESINKRFNESFELISKRLEEVQKGLGEMQTLASDVGGLKKVLTNVKTRGTFGEVQLESLLEQILSPEQYETQVAVRENSQERVDVVVKLPGQTDDNSALLLPIDSKFVVEDYQRLYDAYDTGETKEFILALRKKFEDSVKNTAKSIAAKYINPPVTTDFAIMFVPSEGIYAEILRSVELFESLRRDFRITIVGPTNLAAFLSSLQMGFRTLAIQKRTSEVWSILGAVKTEFGKFGDVLDKASNQLQTVAKSITNAGTRTRAIERKLRGVESLPQEQSNALLSDVVEIEQDENIVKYNEIELNL